MTIGNAGPGKKEVETLKMPKITARQRAWNSMRIFRTFCAGDIESTAEISDNNLRVYLRLLVATGYLTVVGRSRRYNKYYLVRDTGPRAPQETTEKKVASTADSRYYRARAIKDPNTGETIPAEMKPTPGRIKRCQATGASY